MTTTAMHLAQANVALARAPLTDPEMRDFVEQLEHINAVADQAPGFVWRFQTEAGDATAVRVFDDPRIIFNMSVWESVAELHDYAFRSDHRGPLLDRKKWFLKMDRPHSVLWWTPVGVLPTVADGEGRLDHLRDHGPSPSAFTFGHLYGPDGRPMNR